MSKCRSKHAHIMKWAFFQISEVSVSTGLTAGFTPVKATRVYHRKSSSSQTKCTEYMAFVEESRVLNDLCVCSWCLLLWGWWKHFTGATCFSALFLFVPCNDCLWILFLQVWPWFGDYWCMMVVLKLQAKGGTTLSCGKPSQIASTAYP